MYILPVIVIYNKIYIWFNYFMSMYTLGTHFNRQHIQRNLRWNPWYKYYTEDVFTYHWLRTHNGNSNMLYLSQGSIMCFWILGNVILHFFPKLQFQILCLPLLILKCIASLYLVNNFTVFLKFEHITSRQSISHYSTLQHW